VVRLRRTLPPPLARLAPLAPFARSGSFRPPVSRFHSSNVSGEIFPCTRSSANFRRCAWLLNGMSRLNSTPSSIPPFRRVILIAPLLFRPEAQREQREDFSKSDEGI